MSDLNPAPRVSGEPEARMCVLLLSREKLSSVSWEWNVLSLSSFLLHTRHLSGGCGSPEILSAGHRCKGPATWLPSSSSSRGRHRFEHPHSKWPLLPRSSPGPGRVCVSRAGRLSASPWRHRTRGSETERQGEGDKQPESRSQTHRRVRGQHTPKRKQKRRAGAHRKEKQNEHREMRPEHVPTQAPVEQLFTRQGFHLPVPGLHLTPPDSMREESDHGNWVTEARR